MNDNIKQRLSSIPESPGIYLMKDIDGIVLYVGKAKNLKNRLPSYFNGSDERPSIEFLLEKVEQIETIVTENERQALVLEADLIKKFKPRYNIRLKDDKAPFMVMINRKHQYPRLELVRKKKEEENLYFGPFPIGYELRVLLDVIERSIPLRTCPDRMFLNRVRPCLQYQIKRCSGPCCLDVSKENYNLWLKQAIDLLKGNTESVIEDYKKQISILSQDLKYEEAATIRDRLRVLEKLSEDKKEVRYGFGNFDAIGIYREGIRVEFSVLKTIDGKLIDNKTYAFEDAVLKDEELIAEFILAFYNSKISSPDEVLIDLELEDGDSVEQYLKQILEKNVIINHPKKGSKRRLLDLAKINAKESFEARHSGVEKADRVLSAMRDTLNLPETPRIIECIDISHLQGNQTVGAVVAFKDTKPFKERYRYFHLSQEGKPDDFASINEVVRRHISRGIEENNLCDLLIIDGGPPQIREALKAREEVGGSIPFIISIAKKREKYVRGKISSPLDPVKGKKPERIYIENKPLPVILKPGNEVLNLIERIRDETHRSVITFHRKIRSKKQFQGPLDSIVGLGLKKKRQLLQNFGSFKRVQDASEEDLVNIGKLPRSLAKKVFTELRKNSRN